MKIINYFFRLAVKFIIPLLVVITVIFLFLPIMSSCSNVDSESYTLTIRLINFPEFSAWGTVAVLSPLIFAAIFYAKLDRKIKTLSLIGTYLFSSVAYVEAVKRAHEWVSMACSSFVNLYPVMFLYPLVIFCVSTLIYADVRIK